MAPRPDAPLKTIGAGSLLVGVALDTRKAESEDQVMAGDQYGELITLA